MSDESSDEAGVRERRIDDDGRPRISQALPHRNSRDSPACPLSRDKSLTGRRRSAARPCLYNFLGNIELAAEDTELNLRH